MTSSSDITAMTVPELQAALKDGATAAGITEAYLDRIAADDQTLGSYLHVAPEAAGRPPRRVAGSRNRPRTRPRPEPFGTAKWSSTPA